MIRLSIAEFLGYLIDQVAERTGHPCHDYPENAESPFYGISSVSTEARNTKTMYIDVFSIDIDAVSAPVEPYSNAPVLRLVQKLEEAMAVDISLPEPFTMYRQDYEGMRAVKRDPSGEGHAVLSFKFWVCYGLRCK